MLAKISQSGSNVDSLSGAIARRNATTFVTSFFYEFSNFDNFQIFDNIQIFDNFCQFFSILKIHSYAK